MTEQDFYLAVGRTSFLERYYSLCKRFPCGDEPDCKPGKVVVLKLLSEIDRVADWDARDRSYSFDRMVPQGMLHLGFVIHYRASLEFWFWLETADDRIGGGYAAIAHRATMHAGKTEPAPPYPRPNFHTVNELRQILVESFDLADILIHTLGNAAK